MMKTAAGIIQTEIKNQRARFVFPSETAASVWARKACVFTGERSVAAGRFLAWDRFKETVIRAELANMMPVSAVVRKLFAEKLVRRNAAEKFFLSLIPPRFAEEGSVFTRQIAASLPSLALWEDRVGLAGDYAPDEEDADFACLKKEYTRFLEEKNLFEPSWVKPPLKDKQNFYYIFFPEAMEDFTEYENLLENEKTIRLVRAEADTAASSAPEQRLFLYDSSRAEIRAAVLEILRLHREDGVPYEEIAVSVPRLEDAEPYLMRELGLYNIPARRRSGKPLADYGAGRIFSLMSACAANGFTFDSLKTLLLDGRLPWQYPETNRALIGFGARNNCVSGYRDKGRSIDVWEEAFRAQGGGGDLGRYYRELKRRITELASSRGFEEIRRNFFKLYPAYLSREKSGEEGAAVLSRCMEELAGLIQITDEYPDLVPSSPFGFYLAHLSETNYVIAADTAGVGIFPYRVAAAAPFTAHFVLNASQAAATVLYQPLRFLRQDKRSRLGLNDTDASRVFFRLYAVQLPENAGRSAPFLRLSAAEKTFAGWAIPHSYFSGNTQKSAAGRDDPFIKEKSWWADRESVFPENLFPIQKQGFASWTRLLQLSGEERRSLLKEPLNAETEVFRKLDSRIKAVQYNVSLEEALVRRNSSLLGEIPADRKFVRVSATDLKGFYACPASWLFDKIFDLEPFSLEAKLLDDASLGMLYHRILEKLFTRIRDEDSVFQKTHLEKYFSWLKTCAEDEAAGHPAFQGPLAVPLVSSQAGVIAGRLRRLLAAEAEEFSGCAVSDYLEKYMGFICGDAIFAGKIDRVSISPDGEPLIIDYKTSAAGTPSLKDSTENPDSPMTDFQIAMYVRLYEQIEEKTVGGAYFFTIHTHKIDGMFKAPAKKEEMSAREKYQPSMDAFNLYAANFVRAVRERNFAPPRIAQNICADCSYKAVCRTCYSLNREASGGGPHGA